MKNYFLFFASCLFLSACVQTQEEPQDMYAQSALLPIEQSYQLQQTSTIIPQQPILLPQNQQLFQNPYATSQAPQVHIPQQQTAQNQPQQTPFIQTIVIPSTPTVAYPSMYPFNQQFPQQNQPLPAEILNANNQPTQTNDSQSQIAKNSLNKPLDSETISMVVPSWAENNKTNSSASIQKDTIITFVHPATYQPVKCISSDKLCIEAYKTQGYKQVMEDEPVSAVQTLNNSANSTIQIPRW